MDAWTTLLDLPEVVVDHSHIAATTITIQAHIRASQAICPTCGQTSTRRHSRYQRHLRDLPWGARALTVTLLLGRWRCMQPACPRRTFVPPLPTVARPYARWTTRATQHLCQLAFALGGEAGARLTGACALATSPDTLLRRIRATTRPVPASPTVIGIDDWAFTKGRRYGTIVVDLLTRRPLALLGNREPATIAAWLRQYPTIQIIARDRGRQYREGATLGAPQAIQVADRWHLFKNCGDALQRVAERHHAEIRRILRTSPAPTPPAPPPPTLEPDTAALLPSQATPPPPVTPSRPAHSRREQLFVEVKRLRADGWSVSAIARHLQLNRRTVTAWHQAAALPVRRLPQNMSTLLPYLDLIEGRVHQGTMTGQEIWREVQGHGFRGSLACMYRLLRHLGWQRRLPRDQRSAPGRPAPASASGVLALAPPQVARWFLCDPTTLRHAALLNLERLLTACPELSSAYDLAQDFASALRTRDAVALASWLTAAKQCGIREMGAFARGLRTDEAAVLAACTYEWSSGPIEAHIHRLKLIKRAMYGRANLDLLQHRVLGLP